jgi:Mpv17 / PMP22 family
MGGADLIRTLAVQDKLVKTIIANYILWPGAHFINFRFVPSEHRILCVAVPLPLWEFNSGRWDSPVAVMLWPPVLWLGRRTGP